MKTMGVLSIENWSFFCKTLEENLTIFDKLFVHEVVMYQESVWTEWFRLLRIFYFSTILSCEIKEDENFCCLVCSNISTRRSTV